MQANEHGMQIRLKPLFAWNFRRVAKDGEGRIGGHRIRHYGLFAGTGRAANVALLRELLGASPPAEVSASSGQDEPAETLLPPCPCCGGRMTVIEFFERGTLPRCRPPSAAVTWFDTS